MLLRKVKVLESDRTLNNQGKPTDANRTILENPVHSLVLLLESDVKSRPEHLYQRANVTKYLLYANGKVNLR